jgi:hypothetical protein
MRTFDSGRNIGEAPARKSAFRNEIEMIYAFCQGDEDINR